MYTMETGRDILFGVPLELPDTSDNDDVPRKPARGANRLADAVDRIAATIDLAAKLRLPHDWCIEDATTYPLDATWMRPILDWMDAHRIFTAGTDQNQTYLHRVSIRTWAIWERTPQWCVACRKGVAWSTLMVSLQFHHFDNRRTEAAHRVMSPSEDFFEALGSQPQLQELLTQAFSYTW